MAKTTLLIKGQIWKGFLGIILSITVFTDIRLFFIYSTQSRTIGYYFYGVFFVFILISSMYFIFKYKFSSKFWLIIGFLLFGFCLDLLNGMKYGDALLQSSTMLCIPIAIILYQEGYFSPKRLSRIIFLISILHLTFIIYSFFDNTLINTYTGYGNDLYLNVRAVGIFQAPGLLSFYSIIVFSYGFIMFIIKKDKLNLFVTFFGLLLGLLSGNRSFIIALSLIIIIFLIWSPILKWGKRGFIYYISLLSMMLLLFNSLSNNFLGDKLTTLSERFDYDLIERDYETRLDGEVGLLPGLMSLTENPLFGNTVMDKNSESIKVSYKNKKFSVNNGFINVIAFRGIPAAILFYFVYFLSIKRYLKIINKRLNTDNHAMNAAFFFMVLGGSIVCMADAFLTSSIMLILLLIPFTNLRHNSRVV